MRWLLFILLFFKSLSSIEYLYPIAAQGMDVYFMHQKSNSTTQLLRYDMQTKLMESVLCPYYYPTQVKLLPTKQGLSFIDQGILKIFYFSKRSAQVVDPGFPVEAISYQWMSDDTVAITANNGSNLFIIIYSLFDDKSKIIRQENIDFYLPVFHQNEMLYVMRENNLFFLMKRDKRESLLEFSHSILKWYSSADNLYAVFYVGNSYQLLNFCVGRLTQEFSYQELFSFSLPSSLVSDVDTKLYEGLDPLLPRIYGDCFYYSDVQIKDSCNSKWLVKRYAMSGKQDVLGSVGDGHCCFSLLLVGQTLFYGDVVGPMTNRLNNSDILNYPAFSSFLKLS